tara:strand:+ start:90 stop:467 length:378 start_codon:yes stop_codon:yes gene_type:complete
MTTLQQHLEKAYSINAEKITAPMERGVINNMHLGLVDQAANDYNLAKLIERSAESDSKRLEDFSMKVDSTYEDIEGNVREHYLSQGFKEVSDETDLKFKKQSEEQWVNLTYTGLTLFVTVRDNSN